MIFSESAAALGRETEAAVQISRPRLRFFPGPVVITLAFVFFAGLTVFGYSTFRAEMSPEFYRSMAYGSAIMFALAVLTTIWWLTLGITMEMRELGVVMTYRKKSFAIRFADIDAFTVADSPRYDNYRNVVALHRTITIEASGRKAVGRYLAMPSDVLDAMLARLVARITGESRPRSGDRWELDRAILRWGGEAIAVGAIAKAGVFDGNVRAWRMGEELPFLSVPHSSRNARILLHRLQNVQPSLAGHDHRVFDMAGALSQDGPGRLLFVRRTTVYSEVIRGAIIGSVLWVGWLAVDRFLRDVRALGHGAIIGLGVLAFFYAIHRLTTRYRFYDRALTRDTILGSRTMQYSQVAKMMWRETVTLINHSISAGTRMKVRLVPADGKALTVDVHRFRGTDNDVALVRAAMAENIARSLRKQLEREGRVQWTRDAAFLREGLEVKTGVLGNKPLLIPYDDWIGVQYQQGYLNIHRESWRKPLAMLEVRGENFYPGLALCYMLMQRIQSTEEERRA